MEILRFSKLFWTYVSGVHLRDSGSRRSADILSLLLNLFHTLSLGTLVGASVAYYYHEWRDLSVAHRMMVILQIIPNSSLLMNFLVYCFRSRKEELAKLVGQFQKIVSERYSTFTAEIYEVAERKSEFISKWPFVFFFVTVNVALAVCTAVFYIIALYQGEMNVHSWPNVLQFRLPYMPYAADDITTHSFHCFIQMIMCYSHFCLFSTNLSTFLSFYYYLDAFCGDLRHVFTRIDAELKAKPWQSKLEVKNLLLDVLKLQKKIIK